MKPLLLLDQLPHPMITGPLYPSDGMERVLEPRVVIQLARVQLRPSSDNKGFVRIPALAYTNADHGFDVLDIPAEWDSPQLLEFCGFAPEAANRYYQIWKKRRSTEDPDGVLSGSAFDELLVDVALELMRTPKYDELYASGNWEGALTELGIADDVIASIMDPRYEKVRNLADPCHWVEDTVTNNYEFLVNLSERIAARRDFLRSIRNCRVKSREPSPTVKDPTDAPTSTAYYIPAPFHLIQKAFNSGGMHSYPGFLASTDSEFHPSSEHYIHLLADKELALELAGFIASRSRCKQAGLFKVAFPNTEITTMIQAPASDRDWQGLVWFSRNRRAKALYGGSLPRSLQCYADMPFFVAPFCGLSEEKVTALPSHRDIQPVILEDGKIATQLVLQTDKAREFWWDHMAERVVLETVSDVASELAPLISRADINDDEWENRRMDCWNGWRWNQGPSFSWDM